VVFSFRQKQIIEIARSEGHVSVQALSAHFAVTLQTIRRDLSGPVQAGLLDRVHGGAMLAQGKIDRAPSHHAAKTAIARACAAQIPNACTVALNLGTTTEAVAQALLRHTNLTVLTNSLPAARTLMANPSCEVILTGGVLRRPDGAMVDANTALAFRQFKADIAVIGCFAIDPGGDLLSSDLAQVQVNRAILSQARQTFLVADQSKFTRKGPARLTSLADLQALFTDAPLPAALADLCRTARTSVHVAPVQHFST
jgi:DeoR family glycerol-3-phosphate regulon repressor